MADYSGGDAAEQLDKGAGDAGGGDAAPDKSTEGREDTFFLPADFPGVETLKPGDPLNLRVVGKDAEGKIEVEHVPMEGREGDPEWKSDLKRTVPTTPGGAGMGMTPEM